VADHRRHPGTRPETPPRRRRRGRPARHRPGTPPPARPSPAPPRWTAVTLPSTATRPRRPAAARSRRSQDRANARIRRGRPAATLLPSGAISTSPRGGTAHRHALRLGVRLLDGHDLPPRRPAADRGARGGHPDHGQEVGTEVAARGSRASTAIASAATTSPALTHSGAPSPAPTPTATPPTHRPPA